MALRRPLMFSGMDAVSDWLHYIAFFGGFIGFRNPKKEEITIKLCTTKRDGS
jgi:hypothetical protein